MRPYARELARTPACAREFVEQTGPDVAQMRKAEGAKADYITTAGRPPALIIALPGPKIALSETDTQTHKHTALRVHRQLGPYQEGPRVSPWREGHPPHPAPPGPKTEQGRGQARKGQGRPARGRPKSPKNTRETGKGETSDA